MDVSLFIVTMLLAMFFAAIAAVVVKLLAKPRPHAGRYALLVFAFVTVVLTTLWYAEPTGDGPRGQPNEQDVPRVPPPTER